MNNTVHDITFTFPVDKNKKRYMDSDTVVWYHGDCNDGLAALSSALAAAEKHGLNRHQVIHFPVQYDLHSKTKKITAGLQKLVSNSTQGRKRTKLLIVDFSFPIEELIYLVGFFEHITIIDHHPLPDGFKERYDAISEDSTFTDRVEFIHSPERSGGYLTYLYFNAFGESFFPQSNIPGIIQIADDHDRWKHNFEVTKPFIEGVFGISESDRIDLYVNGLLHGDLNAFVRDPDDYNIKLHVKTIIERGRVLLKAKYTLFNNLLKNNSVYYDIFVATKRGHKPVKLLCINAPAEFRSELPDYFFETHHDGQSIDLCVTWSCVGESKYRYSARSNVKSERVDSTDPNNFFISAQALADSFQGYGHIHASGFYSDKTPDKLFLR